MTKNNNELKDKTDRFEISTNHRKFSRYSLEENLFSRCHRVQSVENQNEALPTRLAELQCICMSHSQNLLVRALIGT